VALPDPKKCHVKKTVLHPAHLRKHPHRGYLLLLNEILQLAAGVKPEPSSPAKGRGKEQPATPIVFFQCYEVPVHCPYLRPLAGTCFCTHPYFGREA